MALVPWIYSNPFIDRKSMEKQQFTFLGQYLEVYQKTDVAIDITKNTGLKLWDGAYLLAKYIESEISPGQWKGKSCVELGAGCGLVGTVAWLQGANTTLTDQSCTIQHTQKCMERNLKMVTEIQHDSQLTCTVLEWGCDDVSINYPVDIIVGSDIVYNPESLDKLIKTLKLFSTTETKILLSYKPRGLGEDVFFSKLRNNSFMFNTVPKEKYPNDFLHSQYVIYDIIKTGDSRTL